MIRRVGRSALLLVLTVGACLMVVFFNDPRPQVAVPAIGAWCCFLVALWKAPRP